MAARFVLSLDCEGKWGVADLLATFDHRQLADRPLRKAYEGIVRLLDRLELPATFAFVGLFGESAEHFARLRPEVERLARNAPQYLRPALDDIDRRGEGWHGSWAVDLAGGARARHEIALHGVTHVPWNSVDADFIREELDLVRSLSSPVRNASTFVYPRNDVAHASLLPSVGIRGYRLAPRTHGRRAVALLSEFNLLERSEKDPAMDHELVRIPGGYFVNWQHGLRRLVPLTLTAARLDHMLDHAERHDGVVHLWLHPENVATSPATLRLLESLLELVAKRRDKGRCHVLRQIDYVSERLPAPRE